ncbi:MCM DNA helicase complex subunit mcm6 [Exophiala xenobiotica]|nr:MCM DNA helicase complex subunit mcm6 [Exophiala xenobiotica]
MSAPIMSRFDLFFVVLDECNENVDRHLAEHIVNLHMLKDDFVQPEFSTEQLQRYIRFARTFKPKFTPEAMNLLVQKYKELRANDAGGLGRNSYRITVRQLESLIRLSEAIAKANCVEDITVPMVLEAFDLLKQSIITVEKDDVDVEDDDEEPASAQREEAHEDRDSPMAEEGEQTHDEDQHRQRRADGTPAAPSGRVTTKITFEKYHQIQNMLASHIRDEEDRTGEGPEHDELLVWYLEQVEESISNEDELNAERSLAKKVLKRMVKDNVIIPIRGEGLVDDDQDQDQDHDAATTSSKVLYALHPNCGIFDDD